VTQPPDSEQSKAPARFEIIIVDEARDDLASIKDTRTAQAIARRVDKLEIEPLAQGKPLTDDLKGFYSVRAAGQRYRIVYQVAVLEGRVIIAVIGIRRAGSRTDVYEVARKRVGGD
jgi:mRNA interferase RelE/StbE